MDIGQELVILVKGAAREAGLQLGGDMDVLRRYAATRMEHLATTYGEPGYDLALRAERDAVALAAGMTAVGTADAADARVRGVIEGALGIGARALAGGAL